MKSVVKAVASAILLAAAVGVHAAGERLVLISHAPDSR